MLVLFLLTHLNRASDSSCRVTRAQLRLPHRTWLSSCTAACSLRSVQYRTAAQIAPSSTTTAAAHPTARPLSCRRAGTACCPQAHNLHVRGGESSGGPWWCGGALAQQLRPRSPGDVLDWLCAVLRQMWALDCAPRSPPVHLTPASGARSCAGVRRCPVPAVRNEQLLRSPATPPAVRGCGGRSPVRQRQDAGASLAGLLCGSRV